MPPETQRCIQPGLLLPKQRKWEQLLFEVTQPLFLNTDDNKLNIYLTPKICSEAFVSAIFIALMIFFVNKIGFQCKDKIFSFHLIPFA